MYDPSDIASQVSSDPLVSVLCLTYKHERFIEQALQGFVSQQTSFSFEVLIGDDASPDATPTILRDYATRYPFVLFPELHSQNRGSGENMKSIVKRIRGRYVCVCDGDDYWTDPLKLQKQVDFLESHPECSMCFHNITTTYDDGSRPDEAVDSLSTYAHLFKGRDHLTLPDILWLNPIASLSVMYRWRLGTELPEWIFRHTVIDLSFHLLHADAGNIGFVNEAMGVYRRHSGGAWWGHETLEHKKKTLSDFIALLSEANEHMRKRHDEHFSPLLSYLRNDFATLRDPSCLDRIKRRLKSWFAKP